MLLGGKWLNFVFYFGFDELIRSSNIQNNESHSGNEKLVSECRDYLDPKLWDLECVKKELWCRTAGW